MHHKLKFYIYKLTIQWGCLNYCPTSRALGNILNFQQLNRIKLGTIIHMADFSCD